MSKDPTTKLSDALEYASLGWSVFPVDPTSKRPRTTHGYHDATTDAAIITAHWTDNPDDNIGMPMRPNGMIAIDIDPRNGGIATFAAMEQVYGALPRDRWQRSASGGLHIMLRDNPERRPRGKADYLKLGTGVDFKCNGYCLVEGSTSSSGARYEWIALDPYKLPEIPERWVELLYHPIGAEIGNDLGLEEWQHSTDGPLTLSDATDLRAALKALGPRMGGNSTTFKAIRRIFHDYGLGLDDGAKYLAEWNDNCGAPHATHELERKVMNAASVEHDSKYGQRGHARKSLPSEARIARAGVPESDRVIQSTQHTESGDESAACAPITAQTPSPLSVLPSLIDLPPPVEPSAYEAQLHRAFDDVRTYTNENTDDVSAEKPFFKPAHILFTDKDAPPVWLVQGLVVEGGIAVVATEPKSAKTWLATEIAVAVATGTPALGEFKVKPGAVAYFYTEDLGAAIKTRVRSLLKGRGLGINALANNFHAQPRERAIDVSKLEDCARIIASARMCGPLALLVLDPLRNIHTSEEDKADAMSAVFRNLRMIGTLLDCTILLVHHSAKASENSSKRRPGQRMRGSGAIHGFVDSGIYLENLKTPNPGTFTNTVKSEVKAARSAGQFELTLHIKDDEATQSAVEARWEIGTVGETNADEAKVESWEEKALEIVDAFALHKLKSGRSQMTAPEVDKVVKGNSATKQIARERARSEGWLRQDPRNKSWHITPAGEAISRERHTKSDTIPEDELPKGKASAFAE